MSSAPIPGALDARTRVASAVGQGAIAIHLVHRALAEL